MAVVNEEKKTGAEGKTPEGTEKKTGAEGKESTEGGSDDEDPAEDDEKELSADEAKAEIKKLRAENAKRRLNQKETGAKMKALTEDQAKKDKALAILQGKEVADIDPLVKAKEVSDGKMRSALIRASLASQARDAHDPAMLYQVNPKAFAEVEVDLDTESVDEEQLDAVVSKMRKAKPFLFTPPEGKEKPNGRLPPDGKGAQPVKGQNERAIWNKLNEEGKTKEATEFYAKNKTLILQQMRD